jgi:hypothetical protein
MSQENVEVVRRVIEECSSKRDELPAIISKFWDADGDYYPVRKFPDRVPRHGREEFSRWMVGFHETWVRFENPIKQLLPVGDDRVLALTAVRAEGPGSRITVQGDLYYCVWLRHGLILRWEDHLTLKGALYALGLHGETLKEAGLSE